ncbi:MAG: tRNA (adenosine(37)-N6)-threonylcarbamoyltransferase complex dimerization subunit type 1 TsaB [Deltaproteobacteria bacterium]|nr:tRNA (adenosine(37)-N6)-threonylcarbamoyltransferase complex dimerization subunit type 1 TsaB [Deltaproteobacteria bacterium]
MRILALDTSTVVASAALVEDRALLSECSQRLKTNHAREFLYLIERALEGSAPLGPEDTVAVGVGPGAFTGVRVALSTAKGLHLATGCSLLGVSSLEALALDGPVGTGPVLALLDARREEIYAALYEFAQGGAMTTLIEPCHHAPEVLGELVRYRTIGPVAAVHDLPEVLLGRLQGALPGGLRASPLRHTPRASRVAELVLRGRGERDEGALEPAYVRGPDAKLPGAP